MTMIDQREWSKLFPLDTNTFDGSTLFIQRLFTVTLSALTAKRRIFSDEHFSTKKLGRLNVPLFTRPESIIEKQRFTKTVFSWVNFHRLKCFSLSVSFERVLVHLDSRRFTSNIEELFKISDIFCYFQIGRFSFRNVRILFRL